MRRSLTKNFIIIVITIIMCCIFGFMSMASQDIDNDVYFKNEKCGTNAYATLYKNGDLIISGSGSLTVNEWDNPEGFVDPWNYSPPWNKGYSNPDYRDFIKKVIISEGIVAIDLYEFEGAFVGCVNLIEAVLPESLETIGPEAFQNCISLIKIDIPKNVKKIGGSAFRGCSSLRSIDIPENVKELDDAAFESCYNLTDIILPEGLEIIEGSAFGNCIRLEEMILPESLTYIGGGAFNNCIRLSKITVESKDCKIENYRTTFPESTVLYGYKSSTLEKYAEDWQRKFVVIGEDNNESGESGNLHQHTYPNDWSVIVEPDCETKGINVKICLGCNNLITQVLPKSDHTDKNNDYKCDNGCGYEFEKPASDKPSEKPCDCDCHKGGITAFFFKLINFFIKIFDKSAGICECGAKH